MLCINLSWRLGGIHGRRADVSSCAGHVATSANILGTLRSTGELLLLFVKHYTGKLSVHVIIALHAGSFYI